MNLRKCVSCGKRSDKFDFIRINRVKNQDSGFKICLSNVGNKLREGLHIYVRILIVLIWQKKNLD